MVGLSCRSAQPPRETLSAYFWDVQTLRMEAGTKARAQRDLGVIYLRTGHFEEAAGVLARALAQDRADPKLWFYAGLAHELLGRPEAALTTYEQAPTLSVDSPYSRATKGRIAWLREDELRRAFAAPPADDALPPPGSLSPDTYAVFPFACQGGLPQHANLGAGLSEVLSRNLGQLQGLDAVDPGRVRAAFEQAAAVPAAAGRAVRVGRMLGAGKIVGGTCTIQNGRIAVDLVLRDLTSEDVLTASSEQLLEAIPALERDLMDQLIDALRLWLPNRERRTPVTGIGLDALVAYSQGLAFEAAGDLERSAAFYREAQALQPRFAPALARAEAAETKQMARGTGEAGLMALTTRLEADAVTPYLLEARLQQLGRRFGFGTGAGIRPLPPGTLGELPAPPRPTGN